MIKLSNIDFSSWANLDGRWLDFQGWGKHAEHYKDLNLKVCGKSGFINIEKPLIDMDKIKKLLLNLVSRGYILGIGTGRSLYETENPLKRFGIWNFFDQNSIVTYDNVINAQEYLKLINKSHSLAKPHPYVFLKAAMGNDKQDEFILNTYSFVI